MSNKSHSNSGLRAINNMNLLGKKHSTYINQLKIDNTDNYIIVNDCLKILSQIPDNSIQLILIDPPYNLDLDVWDSFENYLDWAKQWLCEIYRILKPEGNCVIFGGFQYQDKKNGDLLEIMHYARHNTKLRIINIIIWYYKNGMTAYRYFANRHEECIWFSKTKKYYFNLDSVRIPYDEKGKISALRDQRLKRNSVEKGKNPTNVWEIGRLSGNSNERVGHPTQKPVEIVRRLVNSLSYKGSVVLDFFAGSGTTGRVCIEEERNCILVDKDPQIVYYFKKHLKNVNNIECLNKVKIHYNSSIKEMTKNLFNL